MDEQLLSAFRFDKYVVNKVDFDINENFSGRKIEDINFSMGIDLKVANEELKAILTVNVIIYEEAREHDFPYNLSVTITGYFSADGKMENVDFVKFCKLNGLSIIFPFIRSTIADITRVANVETLLIPAVNIHNLVKEVGSDEPENKESEIDDSVE